MSPAAAFHAQLASIMEVLANTAVAEICELVDSGYSVLQLELSRSRKENELLRRKLRLVELRAARAAALRAAGTAGGALAGSRARAQLSGHPGHHVRRTPGAEEAAAVAAATTAAAAAPTAMCGGGEPAADSGQDTAHRELSAADPVKLQPPVIKVERDEEAWTDAEHDGFCLAIDGQPGESRAKTEAPPLATKQEVSEQDSNTSCSWAAGEVSSSPVSSNLTTCKRSESSTGLPEPVSYDCMVYNPQIQHGSCSTQNPLSEDPGCSYTLSTSVSVSAPSDTGSSFPFVISEVTHQPPAGFPDSRQRAPPQSDQPQTTRKEITAAPNAFILREGWRSQDAAPASRDESGGKSFVCSCCGKTLACLKNLKTHMRVHTGEKPFSCALCGKRFSDSSNLKRHQSVHTGEKRYSCVHCGKRFAQSGSLKVHMTVHTGCKQFRCLYCGKTFISANHLRRHMSVHDAEKHLTPTLH